MKATMKKTGLLLFLFGLIQISGGCIMEDRVVELVVSETTCVEFVEDQSSVSFVTPATVNYAAMLNEILDDNDISREDIVSARLVSASYGVTHVDPAHDDWKITGSITIERVDKTDGPETLWDYTSVAIADALGKTIPAVLNGDGVGVLNRALDALAEFRTNGFIESPTMTAAWSEFRDTTDPLGAWLDRNLVLGPSLTVPKADLLAAYNADAERCGRPIMGDVSFGRAVKRLRPELQDAQRTVNGELRHVWLGVGLKASP